jgi:hypothetical protein
VLDRYGKWAKVRYHDAVDDRVVEGWVLKKRLRRTRSNADEGVR